MGLNIRGPRHFRQAALKDDLRDRRKNLRQTRLPHLVATWRGEVVGYAEHLQVEQGLDARAAALAAGKRRMRPVFLTTAAAAIGVVPMILSGSTLWGPLGAVTCFGLLFSMVLTLFVLPVLYLRLEPRRARAACRCPR